MSIFSSSFATLISVMCFAGGVDSGGNFEVASEPSLPPASGILYLCEDSAPLTHLITNNVLLPSLIIFLFFLC